MNIAVIFAGGLGQRMHTTSRPKQFLEYNGKPVIIYTLELFEAHPLIDGIIVSCVEEWIPFLHKMLERFGISKVKKVVAGGNTGQDSIYNGLVAAKQFSSSDNDVVLIHDGVRPFIDEKTITDNINTVIEKGCCITCVPATETFVVLKTSDRLVIPSRSDSYIAKAPQSFYLKDILAAHERARNEGKHDFIDSCSMMYSYGHKLALSMGPAENIKITTSTDFFLFKATVDAHENKLLYGI